MRFKGRSGITVWITSLLLLAATVFLVFQRGAFDSPAGYWILLVVMLAVTLLTWGFILRNHILVTEKEVRVCFGVTTTVLETASVVSLKRKRGILASASASSRRIEVRYRQGNCIGFLYISPKEEEKFIQAVRGFQPDVGT